MKFRSNTKTPDPRDPRADSLLHPADKPERDTMVLLGLPFDGSISTRPGARMGPGALRDVLSSLTTFGNDTDLSQLRCRDLGDLELPLGSIGEAHKLVEQASRAIFEASSVPFFIGGDNGLTGAIIRGLAQARPEIKLGLVVIDSHYDVREYDSEDSLSNGTPYRRALETPICSGERTFIIGTRSFANSSYYNRWLIEQKVTHIPVEEFDERPARKIASDVRTMLEKTSDAIFLSIDIDSVTSSEAPGSSAAAPGGLHSREAIAIVREIAGSSKLIGADLSELSPPWDVQFMTAKLAARLFLEVMAGVGMRGPRSMG